MTRNYLFYIDLSVKPTIKMSGASVFLRWQILKIGFSIFTTIFLPVCISKFSPFSWTSFKVYFVRKPSISSAAATAAKSLQSCLTLCDPTDGSPPGSAIPGISQARVLEWVAIAFSAISSSFSKMLMWNCS